MHYATPVLLALASTPMLVQGASQPALMLAGEFTPSHNVTVAEYLVSEKLDGVRAYWNGQQLLSRSGMVIHTPAWFTAQLPPVALDGELWAGRGRFEQVSTLVRRFTSDDQAWRGIRFQLFDLPAHPGRFSERQAALQALIAPLELNHVEIIQQRTMTNRSALEQWLHELQTQGGEGLMLHHRAAHYLPGRSQLLLKYKPHQDAEARVIGYTPGQGKYAGMTGALLVEDAQGRRFRLGSGLTDADRSDPPPVGALVTYRYNGLTSKGLPRFARFLRVRDADL